MIARWSAQHTQPARAKCWSTPLKPRSGRGISRKPSTCGSIGSRRHRGQRRSHAPAHERQRIKAAATASRNTSRRRGACLGVEAADSIYIICPYSHVVDALPEGGGYALMSLQRCWACMRHSCFERMGPWPAPWGARSKQIAALPRQCLAADGRCPWLLLFLCKLRPQGRELKRLITLGSPKAVHMMGCCAVTARCPLVQRCRHSS